MITTFEWGNLFFNGKHSFGENLHFVLKKDCQVIRLKIHLMIFSLNFKDLQLHELGLFSVAENSNFFCNNIIFLVFSSS